MKGSQTISRNIEASHPYGFDRLRKDGIDISQDLSGLEWTDYNHHDPGVTILEQVCFGLTDLIYRTKFDVADYLCDESGSISMSSLGLHAPQDVFFGRPSTAVDYKKALLDMSSDISDVEFFGGANGSDSDAHGLYKIRVRKSSEGVLENAELAVQIRSHFNKLRNLCEDIDGEIEVIEEVDCYLSAEISAKPGYRIANVLAEVFHKAAEELSKSVVYKPFSAGLLKGESIDEIFEGPYTQKGLIENEQVAHTGSLKNKRLLESDILSSLREVDGVEYIDSLNLKFFDEGLDESKLSASCMYRLIDPSSAEAFKNIVLKSSGRPAAFALDEFRAQFDTLRFANGSKSYPLSEDLLLSKPFKGTHRKLAAYQSVQNHFPDTYGINQFGVPESYSAERKAQALQLKSYLLLFEQIMSNYLANLGSIRQLFSVNGREKSTYSPGVLSGDDISNLDRIYPKDAEEILKGILSKVDNYVNRKSRLLDYLLALYGESFDQAHFRAFNYYHSDEELEKFILFNKVRLLNRIKFASGDRGSAQNMYATIHISADSAQVSNAKSNRLELVSGLQYRISLFLGFRNLAPCSLVSEIFRHDLTLLSHDQFLQESSQTGNSSSLFETKYIQLAREAAKEKLEPSKEDETYYRVVRENTFDLDPFKNRLLSESVLQNGVFDKNYTHKDDSDELLLSLNNVKTAATGGSTQIRLLADVDQRHANKSQRFLRRLMVYLNNESEGMHVLEHILLRPANFGSLNHETRNKYTNVVSVIFPSWTARFSDVQFRSVAQDLVHSNCPAHIHPEIHWLDFASMCEFEVLHSQWSALCTEPDSLENSTKLDLASRQLIRFLELQKASHKSSKDPIAGWSTLTGTVEKDLSHYVDRLSQRRKELELSFRRGADEEQKYLKGIELLQSELKKFKFFTVEHMQLMSSDCELEEDDWEFYVSNITIVLPKLFSFRVVNEYNSQFHEVKKIVEAGLKDLLAAGLNVSFHWVVPNDMREFVKVSQRWEKMKPTTSSHNDEWLNSAGDLKRLLKELDKASDSTGDIHEWFSVFGESA